MIQYTIIRSRRKTVAIHITKDAKVEVRAPMKTSKADINRFVSLKERWILSHLAEREESNSEKAAFSLDYGDTAVLCGIAYPIRARAGDRVGFDGDYFYMPPGLPPESVKDAVIQIYKTVAKQVITSKVKDIAGLMGVKPSAVKINGAKTRWGSCSGKNSLNFSWRLILADDAVIDYVVVHELAHIREHNHSPRFWTVVESVLPDYKERKRRLKDLQIKLAGEDWD